MSRLSQLKSIPGYQIVSQIPVERKEFIVLLEKDGLFSVCRVQANRVTAITANYESPDSGVLTAPLNTKGLDDLLFWSDRNTADQRFNELLRERNEGRARLRLVS